MSKVINLFLQLQKPCLVRMIKHLTVQEPHAKLCYRNINEEKFIDFSIFSPAELKQFESFKNEKRRQIFYQIRFIARSEGIDEILYNEEGKPRCSSHHISISHSGDWVGLMISNKEVGLDIECDTTKILKIKDRFLSEQEQNQICSNELKKMSICWSAKEAVFKMIGGDTTFFKSNQKVTALTSDKVIVNCKNGHDQKEIIMKIKTLDNNYHLVYTM